MARKTTPSENPRKLLVREEILSKAAEVFERRGFAQTRIQDIAEALSLSRSSLYHYFKSKEEILAALVEEATGERSTRYRNGGDGSARPAAERLRDVLRATIAGRLASGSRLRALDQLAAEMPDDLRKTFDRGRRRVLDFYTGLIAEGVENGEFRAIDARTAALAVLGIASWTSWWYRPGGRKTPEEIVDILVDIAMNGLAAPGHPSMGGDRATVLASIRSGLDLLEKL